jgi:hypothetical protein
MADVSLVGLIMNASATMGEAFAQMQRFGALAVELESAPGQPRFQLAERGSQLWMTDTRTAPNDFPELTEAAFARLVCGPRRFLAPALEGDLRQQFGQPAAAQDFGGGQGHRKFRTD